LFGTFSEAGAVQNIKASAECNVTYEIRDGFMDKISLIELFGPPSVVFILFYIFMFSRNLNSSLEFSLFMAFVTLLMMIRKNFAFKIIIKRKPDE